MREPAEVMDPNRCLVAQCLAHVEGAWEMLVEEYSSLVWTICRNSGATSHYEANESLQRTFVLVWENLDSLRDPTRLPAWISRIARRVVSAGRERRNTRTEFERRAALEADSAEPSVSQVAELAEVSQILREAVSTLREPFRAVLEELFFSGESPNYKEVAQNLGMAEGSIGPTRARALEALKEHLLLNYRGFLVSNFGDDLS